MINTPDNVRPADDDFREAPMKPKKSMPGRLVTIEREEYDALMSGLPTPEVTSISQGDEEKFRRIKFYLMVLVCLVLAVFMLCKN